MKLQFTTLGDGDPVILMHGLFGSMSNLRGLGRLLASHFRVLMPDLRNHGKSAHSDCMDYPTMAADIVELMDSQNIGRADLVGHSMGGKVAMQVALGHPHRAHSLVAVDIAPVTYGHHHQAAIAGLHAVEEAATTTRKEADEVLAQFVETTEVRSFLLKNLVKTAAGRFALQLNLEAIESCYDRIAGAPEGEPFTGPALFIRGGASDYVGVAQQQAILRLFPNATIDTLAGAGHWLHAEQPELFNRRVLDFLQSR